MQIDLPDDLLSAVMQANLLTGSDASITETIQELCASHIENSVIAPTEYTGACVRCKRYILNEIVVADVESAAVDVVCRDCWENFTGREALDRIEKLNRLLK